MYLRASPYISLYLPGRAAGDHNLPYISFYLPVISPYLPVISLYLPISPCISKAEQLEITIFAGRGLDGPDPFSAAAAAVVASGGKAGSALTFAALAASQKEPRVKLSLRLVDSSQASVDAGKTIVAR